jgi:hypothetical protein
VNACLVKKGLSERMRLKLIKAIYSALVTELKEDR